MKILSLTIIVFLSAISLVFSQGFNTSGGNTTLINSTDKVGLGISNPSFKLEIDGTSANDRQIGIDGKVVLYRPDIENSLVLGDGSFSPSGLNDGRFNTLIGYNISTSVAGLANTLCGAQAGEDLTTGWHNTLIGVNAGRYITTQEWNMYLGSNSGRSNDGSYNIGIGGQSLSLASGSNNVAIGYNAGKIAGSGNVFLGYSAAENETGSNKLYIENSNSSDPLIYGEFDNDIVGINGSLGVGTESPSAELHVVGDAYVTGTLNAGTKINAAEVEVMASVGAPDYVFEDSYNLMSLSDIEAFVKANKHLPEIPNAAEFKENGINVGEMQFKLLKKIEELTLHIIEQQKKIEALEAKMKK